MKNQQSQLMQNHQDSKILLQKLLLKLQLFFFREKIKRKFRPEALLFYCEKLRGTRVTVFRPMSLLLNKQSRIAVITGSVIKSSSTDVPNEAQGNRSGWGSPYSTLLRLLPGTSQERDLPTKHSSFLCTCTRTHVHTHTRRSTEARCWVGETQYPVRETQAPALVPLSCPRGDSAPVPITMSEQQPQSTLWTWGGGEAHCLRVWDPLRSAR